MIELFYFTSPNVRKVRIALDELELAYEIRWVDITRGEQFDPAYLQINPNSKVPAIIDHDGPDGRPMVLFESGSILLYLAEKAGRLLPTDPGRRWEATCWVFWQAANQGPACGNATYFSTYAPNMGIGDEHARDRFTTEARRCYAVLERRLTDHEYLADEFSVADIACFPWTRVAKGHTVSLVDYPAVRAWSDRIARRPSARAEEPRPHPAGRDFRYTPEQFALLFPAEAQPPAQPDV